MDVPVELDMLGLLSDDSTEAVSWTTLAPKYILQKTRGLRSVVGVTCVLSIVGSVIIILSYLFFRDLRSNARLILVHLSVSDFAVSFANLCGDAAQFGNHFNQSWVLLEHRVGLYPTYINNLCIFQGFIAHFFTISSVLWTLTLAAYMYVVTTKLSRLSVKENRVFILFSCLLCYGLATIINAWMIYTNRLGYSPFNTSGWCGSIVHDVITKQTDYFGIILGYDLWILLTNFFIIVIYLSLHLYIRQEKRNYRDFVNLAKNIDYKFILIPVTFVLLRMWSFILNVLVEYIQIQHIHPRPLHMALIYLSGIGDSGQGAANAILFVIFTHNVRQRYISFFYRCFSKKSSQEEGERSIITSVKDFSDSLNSQKILYTSSLSGPILVSFNHSQLKGKKVAMTPKSKGSSTTYSSTSDSDSP